MKKDVIYIDIEDDITSIIEKLKNSSEKIIALVPPKGNAVLQSAVNLKLLKRAADQAGKQTVVVTSNQALTALAGGLGLYVAKNLQSKPVLAGAVAAEGLADDGLEVSDQPEEPGPVVHDNSSSEVDDPGDEVELSSDELAGLEAAGAAEEEAAVSKAKKSKKDKKKVPNFDSFRKKLLIGGGIALVLIIVLGLFFGRSKASVVLRADTTAVDVAFDANFNTNTQTSDPESYSLKAVSQESKKTVTQSFTATGQKDIGQKATGKVKFSTGAISALGTTIPAGTQLKSSGGLAYVTTESVTISISNYSGAVVGLEAIEPGTKYNGATGSMSGAPASISATISKSPSGGTTQVVTVVTQVDVDKAKESLNQQDTNAVKAELEKGFPNDTLTLDDSFTTTFGNVTSQPAVGEQANEGKLSAEVTYSMLGTPKSDMGAALDAFITTKMTDKDQQRVYDNGMDNIKLEKVSATDKTAVYKVTTVGQYGPQFDTDALKKEIEGKKFGEARSYLQGLPGVKGVDINLTPFWARTLPGADRITIKLDVDKSSL